MRADAEFLEALDQGIAVLRRVGDLRQVGDRGDAGIDRAQCTDQIADIGVFRPVMIGGRAGDVAEIIGQQPVRQHVAQRALIEVMMRVDEAGQHDHARRVDHARLGRDIRAARRDLLALDQYIGLVEIADAGIEGEHHAALEQDTSRAALGESRPPDAGDGGRREQGGSGFHQSAPVTLAVVDRGGVAPLPASPMVHPPAVSDPNLAAPQHGENSHRRQAPIMLVRHLRRLQHSGPALPLRRGLGVAMTKLAGRSCCSGMTVGAPACHNHGVSAASSPT